MKLGYQELFLGLLDQEKCYAREGKVVMRIMGKLVLAIVLLGFIAVSASADDPLTITADGQILISVNGVTRNLAECLAPVGSIQPFAGTTVPQGWLLCDGRAVSRSDFARLYAVIGEAFGQGNGSSTFNLPDMREAAPCGVGTHAAGVMNHDTYDLGQFKDDRRFRVQCGLDSEVFQSSRHQVQPAQVEKDRHPEAFAVAKPTGHVLDALNACVFRFGHRV